MLEYQAFWSRFLFTIYSVFFMKMHQVPKVFFDMKWLFESIYDVEKNNFDSVTDQNGCCFCIWLFLISISLWTWHFKHSTCAEYIFCSLYWNVFDKEIQMFYDRCRGNVIDVIFRTYIIQAKKIFLGKWKWKK